MKPKTVPGGLLVAIEGIDGAGKTTVADALAAWLDSVGASVTVSKEPTRGPWGMKLRDERLAKLLTHVDSEAIVAACPPP